jgi:hypothetical protein
VVFTIDIGVGVMSDVVFYLPEVYVSSQQVERIGQYIVHAFIVRKGVMSGIMHSIHNNTLTDQCMGTDTKRIYRITKDTNRIVALRKSFRLPVFFCDVLLK